MYSKTFNCDCVEGMRALENDCIDLTITSPPYDNIREYNGFSFNYQETLKELYRITKPGGVVVWIVNDQVIDGSESGSSFKHALYAKEIGLNLHDTMIWDKGGCQFPDSVRYYQFFEFMFVFSKGKPKTIHLLKDRKNLYPGKNIATSTERQKDGSLQRVSDKVKSQRNLILGDYGVRGNVWNIPPQEWKDTIHPATFPKRLVIDHMKSWSNEGDVVLDPFLGSGTTRFVAYDMNRNFIGYEISKEYFDEQEERFKMHTSQLSLFSPQVEEDQT